MSRMEELNERFAFEDRYNQQFAFEDMEQLVFSLVHSHLKRYGGFWDDLLSEAYFAFVTAVDSWDGEKGNITTHVYHRVRGRLLEYRRTQAKTCKREYRDGTVVEFQQLEDEHVTEEASLSDFGFVCDFLSELVTDDARILVQAILQGEFQLVVEMWLAEKQSKAMAKRRGVMQYMRDRYRWSERRLLTAWKEVEHIFNGGKREQFIPVVPVPTSPTDG